MGKRLIVGGFLLCLVMALGMFLFRENVSLRETMERVPSHKKPRVVLENFTIRRYQGAEQLAHLRAAYGDFRAPNVVELRGGLDGWRMNHGQKQYMRAGRGIAWFDAAGLSEMLEGNKSVDHAFVREHVHFSFQDYQLVTDEAQYVTRQRLLTGQMPVRMTGSGRWMTGQDGFRYDLNDESFSVYGKVRGMIIPGVSGDEK